MRYIRRFSELGMGDVPLVGGKNASLGEMYCALSTHGVKVPNGFATTTAAYRHFYEHNDLVGRITDALAALDVEDVVALAATGKQIRDWILAGEMPADLVAEIHDAYQELAAEYGADPDVAVRSSATAEDLPNASFAGQQDTYLNIRGEAQLAGTVKRVFASLFTDRAISYRVHQGFDHMDVLLSVGVQKMVRSDKATSGVMFTLDTESGFRDVVFITAAYGLGENVVQGAVNPDEYYVFKPTLETGHRPIIRRHLGTKAMRMVYSDDPGAADPVTNLEVPQAERDTFCLADDEVLELARYAVEIERHYSEQAGQPQPMDIEWAKDGLSGELFIVQARPETVQATADTNFKETFKLLERGTVVTEGKSVGQKIACGKARVIKDASQMHEVQPGDVLVSDITDPDWEPVMKIAAAIVTNRGGRTCHAAIIARELGIPAVVGCGNATETVPHDAEVTVSCAEGNNGYVYAGHMPFEIERIPLTGQEQLNTKIMLNLANPEVAFETCRLPVEGVGLARLEFIINNTIRVHPRALLEYDGLDAGLKAEIDAITRGYPDRRDYFRKTLAEGVATIAAAFYPRQVIVRGEPDARLPRRGALPGAGVRRGVRARVPGAARGARRHGPDQRDPDGAVRAHAGGGTPDRRPARKPRPATWRERPQGHHDVRDSGQRPARRPVPRRLRRLLDRLQRSHPADPRRRSRLGAPDRLRRAQRGGRHPDGDGDQRLQRAGQVHRHLRPGTVRLPRDHRVAGREGHQLDLAQPRQRLRHARDRLRRGSEAARCRLTWTRPPNCHRAARPCW
jgi:pyruvate,water dikinase